MKEINRILNEQFDPLFRPCPTCRQPVEIGERCECSMYEMDSTIDLANRLVDALLQHQGFEKALENCPDSEPLRRHFRKIINNWREEGGL